VSDPPSCHAGPQRLKVLRPDEVRARLARDPRLIIPVGTIERRAPHLPLGTDTILVERLADQLSAEFGVLLAPTVEYGVNPRTRTPSPGTTTVRRKTLHRFMNDLVGGWEDAGVRGFIIITAHGHEPHQEALSTLRSRHASIRTVDIFSARLESDLGEPSGPDAADPVETALLLYIDQRLVGPQTGPAEASIEMGGRLYHLIYQRIADRIFRNVQ
jgi:creatinine amidohydrolase